MVQLVGCTTKFKGFPPLENMLVRRLQKIAKLLL
jgi:hypothetical protein